MYEIYTPKPFERRASSPRNRLWLGEHDGELFSHEACLDAPSICVRASGEETWERERSWVAHIVGLGEDWAIQREFLPARRVRGGGEAYVEYLLEKDVLHEIECELCEPMVPRRGTYRVYVKYESASRGIVLLGREAFREEVRHMRAADFGEVRALVFEEKWAMARRASTWLRTVEQRKMASDYIAQSYQRWLESLPALRGEKAHVQWAMTLREEVLSRWPEIVRELVGDEERGEDARRMPREAIEALRAWLLRQQDALFWVEHRGVLTGQTLWEIYLLEQLSVED